MRNISIDIMMTSGQAVSPSMDFTRDERGRLVIKCETARGGWKRAWIKDRSGSDKDWAGTGKHRNVMRVDGPLSVPGKMQRTFQYFATASRSQSLRRSSAQFAPLSAATEDKMNFRQYSRRRLVNFIQTPLHCPTHYVGKHGGYNVAPKRTPKTG